MEVYMAETTLVRDRKGKADLDALIGPELPGC
jgi:hypothetical protein